MTYYQVLIKCIDRHKGATYTKNLQKWNTIYPLLSNGTENKLSGHHSQAKQGGKREECCEAKHLAEHLLFAIFLFSHTYQYWLGHLSYHSSNSLERHRIPFVSLEEITYHAGISE